MVKLKNTVGSSKNVLLKQIYYLLVFFGLVGLFFLLYVSGRGVSGDFEIYDILEAIIVCLYLFVSVVALFIHFLKKSIEYYFVGIIFFYAAIINIIHLINDLFFNDIIGGNGYKDLLFFGVNPLGIVIPILFIYSYLEDRGKKLQNDYVINKRKIKLKCLGIVVFVILAVDFFPITWSQGVRDLFLLFSGSVAAIEFWFILFLYSRRGDWKYNIFSYYFVFYLIIELVNYSFFGIRFQLESFWVLSFGYGIDVLALLFLLDGLFLELFSYFKNMEICEKGLVEKNLELQKAKEIADSSKEKIIESDKKMVKSLKQLQKSEIRLQKFIKVMVGRELKMIELKEQLRLFKNKKAGKK